MAIMVDEQVWEPQGPTGSTLGDAMGLLHQQISKSGKVIIKVQVDGQELAGEALAAARAQAVGARAVTISTTSQTELAKSMIGRLAALVEYLGGQHRRVAELIEQGQSSKALEQFASVLGAWQQVNQSYVSLLKFLSTSLDDLMVREIPASEVVADFHRQLNEIAGALKNQDLVLLADILQYEMDSAIENWTGLLEAALGVVEKAGVRA